jgi:hypothetical protein
VMEKKRNLALRPRSGAKIVKLTLEVWQILGQPSLKCQQFYMELEFLSKHLKERFICCSQGKLEEKSGLLGVPCLFLQEQSFED